MSRFNKDTFKRLLRKNNVDNALIHLSMLPDSSLDLSDTKPLKYDRENNFPYIKMLYKVLEESAINGKKIKKLNLGDEGNKLGKSFLVFLEQHGKHNIFKGANETNEKVKQEQNGKSLGEKVNNFIRQEILSINYDKLMKFYKTIYKYRKLSLGEKTILTRWLKYAKNHGDTNISKRKHYLNIDWKYVSYLENDIKYKVYSELTSLKLSNAISPMSIFYEESSGFYLKHILKNSNINSLAISGIKKIEVMPHLNAATKLTHLSISINKKRPDLKSICNFTHDSNLSKIFEYNDKITRFDFRFYKPLNLTNLYSLIRSVSNIVQNSNVKYLSMDGNGIGSKKHNGAGLKFFGNFLLKKCQQIETISLANNAIAQSSDVLALSEALSKNVNIKKLILKDNSISDIESFAALILENPGITDIDLENNKIKTSDAARIVLILEQNTHILDINLKGNPICKDKDGKETKEFKKIKALLQGRRSAAEANIIARKKEIDEEKVLYTEEEKLPPQNQRIRKISKPEVMATENEKGEQSSDDYENESLSISDSDEESEQKEGVKEEKNREIFTPKVKNITRKQAIEEDTKDSIQPKKVVMPKNKGITINSDKKLSPSPKQIKVEVQVNNKPNKAPEANPLLTYHFANIIKILKEENNRKAQEKVTSLTNKIDMLTEDAQKKDKKISNLFQMVVNLIDQVKDLKEQVEDLSQMVKQPQNARKEEQENQVNEPKTNKPSAKIVRIEPSRNSFKKELEKPPKNKRVDEFKVKTLEQSAEIC